MLCKTPWLRAMPRIVMRAEYARPGFFGAGAQQQVDSSQPPPPLRNAAPDTTPAAAPSPSMATVTATATMAPPPPSSSSSSRRSATPLRDSQDEIGMLLAAMEAQAMQASAAAIAPTSAGGPASGACMSEREAAMQSFLAMQRPTTSSSGVGRTGPEATSREADEAAETARVTEMMFAYLRGDEDGTVANVNSFVDFLERQCGGRSASTARQRVDGRSDSSRTSACASSSGSSGDAICTTTDGNGDDGVVVMPKTDKEQRFLSTLKEVTAALDAAKMPWFIACGTALGALRERRFIAHDDDIDIGVMFDEVCASRPTGSDDPFQAAVMDFLSVLGQRGGRLVCFDVLGEPESGFQLRLQDTLTGVLVDINAYYVAQDSSSGDKYVWTATHLAESAKRKYGMYRYRNSYPFTLTKRRFYDLELRAPTTRYLDEYFGADWGTPKRYTYDEGLAGEYKNIIPE